ncbi:MAG TPA: lysozyme inhibitor LprI family protein [Gaiellaceae bacterium]|nr:lysozyme inhibitor LprI family protein [Gaiellaceae bacterium]
MRGILASLVTAAAIAPPMIHEPFTALPCPLHPDTTIDVIGCQEHRVLRTDRAIDVQVGAIFGLLRTDARRSTFVAAERSWLQYRRQSCSVEASKFAGGSAQPVALLTCELQRNTTHLADLKATRKTLAQH